MSPPASVDLHYRELHDPGADGVPLLFLHGMFGSGNNWLGLARGLRGRHPCILPDLRNHGRSPHHPVMGYEAMAADLLRLADRLGLGRFSIVAHSMGAKTAMYLALSAPERLERLACLDMAPVTYPPRFGAVFAAMAGLSLEGIGSRREADRRLAAEIPDPALRAYLLQNLELHDGTGRWRCNLQAIRDQGEALRGFPEFPPHRQFPGPALFIHGALSDYLLPEHWPTIQRLFPLARPRPVPGAGHWVHADRPEAVAAALQGFLAPQG